MKAAKKRARWCQTRLNVGFKDWETGQRKEKMADPDMQTVELSTPPEEKTETVATAMPIEETVAKNGNKEKDTGFVPLVTVVGFHHAR